MVDADCGRWSQDRGAIQDAVEHALAHHQQAIVMTQPFISDLHVEQQRALAGMLLRRFSGDARVRYVNLGRLLDVHDPEDRL